MIINCAYCNKEFIKRVWNVKTCSKYCNLKNWRKNNPEKSRQIKRDWRRKNPTSETLSHKQWIANNKERVAHLKARRYARERDAEGSHSFAAWKSLVAGEGYRCVNCQEIKPLTKDHMIPLSKGGTDYIWNIQPLCRNCNSKKHNTINELMCR
jgi:5-methylcytosine-specific restriction endonuclease McrA